MRFNIPPDGEGDDEESGLLQRSGEEERVAEGEGDDDEDLVLSL